MAKIDLSHPVQDRSLSDEEREYARGIMHSYSEIVMQGERMFLGFAQSRGIPENIAVRVLIHAHLWRAGMNTAHSLAIEKATPAQVREAKRLLAAELHKWIDKQFATDMEKHNAS